MQKFAELFPVTQYTKIVIITDVNVVERWQSVVMQSLPPEISTIILPPGESAKNIESLQHIWKQLHDVGCDRKSLIINLGGGVIGDIGGFAASTYMRGIDFINIPTSILAQVDESVGGKTGIDFNNAKNIIGTFQQPKAVIIDIATCETLPKEQIFSGFAEIIKHGLIADETYFKNVTSKNPTAFSPDELIEIIARSCEIKRDIVEKDEKEAGLRKLVNFGHTIGHALEALSLSTNKPLLHGEAISIGMVAEAKLSQLKGLLSEKELEEIISCLKNAQLPVSQKGFDHYAVINMLKQDKKNVGDKILWTLLEKIGKGAINQEVTPEEVSKALIFIDHE